VATLRKVISGFACQVNGACEGLNLVIVGLGVGLLGAFAMSKVLEGMLFEVSRTDPVIFVGVPLVIVVVALLACYFPARRASKVAPAIAIEGR